MAHLVSTGESIFYGVIGFFALLAILVFLRLLFRKGPPHWSQLKIGFFIERTPNYEIEEEEEDGSYGTEDGR